MKKVFIVIAVLFGLMGIASEANAQHQIGHGKQIGFTQYWFPQGKKQYEADLDKMIRTTDRFQHCGIGVFLVNGQKQTCYQCGTYIVKYDDVVGIRPEQCVPGDRRPY